MQNLFGNKNKNDSKEFEEIVEKKRVSEVIQEKEALQSLQNLTQQQLESTRLDLLSMTDIFQSQMTSNKNKQKELMTQKSDLEATIKEKIIEIAKLTGDNEKMVRSSKLLIDENLKLR